MNNRTKLNNFLETCYLLLSCYMYVQQRHIHWNILLWHIKEHQQCIKFLQCKWKWSSQLCLVTLVTNKAQKKFWGSNGIRTHDLRNTGAMLYQLSYEASLEAGQAYTLCVHVCSVKGAVSTIIPTLACPNAPAAILSSIESAFLLSNPFPSKPLIVFLPQKPFYIQPIYSSWW